jgi:hypothetical protein
MTEEPLRARIDPALTARVLSRAPLMYAEPALPEHDRPPFVRAASGIVVVDDALLVIQDDASFIAVVKPTGPGARSIPLPAGPGGRRRFEDALGNKRDKLDLEACVRIERQVLAFGSGSLPQRERVVVIEVDGGAEALRVVDGAALYAGLRRAWGLSPDEVNVEGVAIVSGAMRFFHRGNGPGGFAATCDVELRPLATWLDGGANDPPEPTRARRYDLGDVLGARFGFTDAQGLRDTAVFLASAERSPNTIDDGEVIGSLVGVMRRDDVRVAPLVDASKQPLAVKAEGIALDPRRKGIAFVVLDADDPERPSELCEVRLEGPWGIFGRRDDDV